MNCTYKIVFVTKGRITNYTEINRTLSANALAALEEFNKEQQKHQEVFQKLYDQTDEDFQKKKKEEGINLFKEDWQLSQFWYSDETAAILADVLLEGADENTVIAIVSAPSVYAAIQKKPIGEIPTKHIYLYEYDKRFELLAGNDHFFFYDYNEPLELSDKTKGKVDRLLIDPPFLNEDCQTKCMYYNKISLFYSFISVGLRLTNILPLKICNSLHHCKIFVSTK
ncbi:YGR001C-like protein [Saccharomyces kudriavzevii IFO 1802]|uniref:YGR001C-like protein n=1 Tax=Saccharomyces kudriavzevii (strain ATCC MYA-4449 / AS 2.2408 / CBS 8840 / NBRC 1802 / NCYC 2889) TaxID=226230 RepID=J5RIP8_SACK1|nr:YGR001C-like protein [Saccharomyces kudriavzevii IFO 1802]